MQIKIIPDMHVGNNVENALILTSKHVEALSFHIK